MILDSSALLALILEEPAAAAVLAALATDSPLGAGAPTLTETGLVLTARAGANAESLLNRVAQAMSLEVIPFGDVHWQAAVQAFHRFGKGRHPARLNFGDCMAYATAKLAGRPLLCLGEDFPLTDLELVRLDV